MVEIKYWHGWYAEIPYFKLVFKGDLIRKGNQIHTVKEVRVCKYKSWDDINRFKEENGFIFWLNENYHSSLNPKDDYYLLKRPFLNWVRFFLLLIFKDYELVTSRLYCVSAFDTKLQQRYEISPAVKTKKGAKKWLKNHKAPNQDIFTDFKIERYPLKKQIDARE